MILEEINLKRINKMLSMVISICIISVMSINVFAANKITMTSNNIMALNYANDLESYLINRIGNIDTFVGSDTLSLDDIVNEFAKENIKNYDLSKIAESNFTKTITVNEENKVIVHGDYIEIVGKDIVSLTPKRVMNGFVDADSQINRASGTTSIYSYYYAAYGG
ncbi:MAG: hypothetical protein LBB94_00315, partial [Clostridiales bacterium]|nr:hypothetical protein [Clostridiales bacterium]